MNDKSYSRFMRLLRPVGRVCLWTLGVVYALYLLIFLFGPLF